MIFQNSCREYIDSQGKGQKNLILPTHVHTMADFCTMFSIIEQPIQNYPVQEQKVLV